MHKLWVKLLHLCSNMEQGYIIVLKKKNSNLWLDLCFRVWFVFWQLSQSTKGQCDGKQTAAHRKLDEEKIKNKNNIYIYIHIYRYIYIYIYRERERETKREFLGRTSARLSQK